MRWLDLLGAVFPLMRLGADVREACLQLRQGDRPLLRVELYMSSHPRVRWPGGDRFATWREVHCYRLALEERQRQLMVQAQGGSDAL